MLATGGYVDLAAFRAIRTRTCSTDSGATSTTRSRRRHSSPGHRRRRVPHQRRRAAGARLQHQLQESPAQIDGLFAPDEFRTSDHDPVVVGLDLSSLDVDEAVIVTRPRGGGTLALAASVDGEFDSCPRVLLRPRASWWSTRPRPGSAAPVSPSPAAASSRSTWPPGAIGAVLSLPTAFRLSADNIVTFSATLDDVAHVVDQPGRRIGPIWIADSTRLRRRDRRRGA